MSNAIKVEGLSKMYLIGHKRGGQYSTLRDAISSGTKILGQAVLGTLRGRKSMVRGDKYEEFWALRDVGFEINKGERIGIIGRNGAGKSTLLKILSRITDPTSGRVTMKGRVASLLEVGTGFHPELTGRENIFLNAAILGMSKSEVVGKFDEIVAFSEVEKFLDTPVKRYSSGMYVRLAFAVAAHLEPEILVVDEVLAVGDLQFQKKCLGKMNELGTEGRTVLFVSHNLAAISSLTTRAVLLERGRLIEVGETDRVIKTYLEELRDRSPEIPVAARKDREGNGRVRVISLDITDKGGNSERIPLNNGGQIISIGLKGTKATQIHKLIVAVFDSNRQRVLWLDSSDQIEAFSLEKGNHEISLDITGGVSISPGEYYLNVAVIGAEGYLDYVADAYKFSIEQGDYFGSGKYPVNNSVVFVDHQWNIN